MKKHIQRFRHLPEEGLYGDCHRTAIACLLDLEPEQVPHFGEIGALAEQRGEDYDWRADVERYLNTQGYTQMDYCMMPDNLDNFFLMMEDRAPKVYYLMGGESPRGTNHTIVCCGGGFYHDPHPDGGFIVAPMSNKCYEATFLLPLSMKA